MAAEPPEKRTVVFFDGQTSFHAVRKAFGYSYPNFDAWPWLARSAPARGGDG